MCKKGEKWGKKPANLDLETNFLKHNVVYLGSQLYVAPLSFHEILI